MKIQQHLRDTLLAGIFAGVPIVVTVIIIVWVDDKTQQVFCRPLFGCNVPFLGTIMAVLLIYVIGVVVRSVIGRMLLRSVDTLLRRVPGIRPIYEAWKQVSLAPGGREGMFARAVLVRMENGMPLTLGFTSGQAIEGSSGMIPVFLPNCPNPITGRLYFVPQAEVVFLNISTEEALKLLISTGNYIPVGMADALTSARASSSQG